VIWTLLCLADDDPLCKAAIRLSGALPLLVPVLGLVPFSAPTNAYMGLPALAARALRVLGDSNSCKQEEDSLSPRGSNDAVHVYGTAANNSSKHDKAYWQRTAVHHLARLLRSTEGVLHGYSKQRLHAPPRLSSLNSSQYEDQNLTLVCMDTPLSWHSNIASPRHESSIAWCTSAPISPELKLHDWHYSCAVSGWKVKCGQATSVCHAQRMYMLHLLFARW